MVSLSLAVSPPLSLTHRSFTAFLPHVYSSAAALAPPPRRSAGSSRHPPEDVAIAMHFPGMPVSRRGLPHSFLLPSWIAWGRRGRG